VTISSHLLCLFCFFSANILICCASSQHSLSVFFPIGLSPSLSYRPNNLFTHLRMNWSRVHYWHCMQRGPDTSPRTSSRTRCREANIKATSSRAVTRLRAQSRDFQVTVRPRRSLTAQRGVIMWKDYKARLEAKACRWNTKTPYRTIMSTTRRNGWGWLHFSVIKKSFTCFLEQWNKLSCLLLASWSGRHGEIHYHYHCVSNHDR